MRPLSGPANLVVLVGARLVVFGLSAIYAVLKLLPTQNKIVLMSRLFATTSQDFAAVRAEINRQDATLTVTVLNHRNTNPLRVPMQMVGEMYHLATARACITDSYMAPISVLRHKDGLVVIQMWHALGAIKRFGLAALGTDEGRPAPLARAMRMHQGYDWVIAGGPGMVGPFAESFGVDPEHVLPIGTPRVDLLIDPANVDARRSRIQSAHPQLGVRPVVLYAPTFRKAEPVRVEPLLDAFAGSDYDVVVALHPLDRRDFSHRPGVVQDRSFSTLDWIIVADHVVSDYSAIVFDAAVIDKQLYFYAYDLDDYRNRRGLFVDYEREMPGPVEREAEGIVAAIAANEDNAAALARFRAHFLAPADGHCTRRIVELARHGRPEELACTRG